MDLYTPENMLLELESGCLEVVLIPAPDPRHSGHCIRAVQYQNAAWYRKFCSLYPSSRKGFKTRTRIKRAAAIKALERIIAGNTAGIYAERLLKFIEAENDRIEYEKRAAAEMEKYLRSPEYLNSPISDMPF